jgi:hypothetical protein
VVAVVVADAFVVVIRFLLVVIVPP